MPKNILIFGGAFNPPTLAHEAIIAECLALAQFDEIWLMPSGDRLDKTMAVSDRHRLRMAEIIKSESFADNPRLRVTDFELKLPRPTKTYQTAAALARSFPHENFWWAIGADSFFDMPNWEQGAELQRTLNMLVFGRGPGDEIKHPNVINLQLPSSFSDMSSTIVRESISKGEPAVNMVSPSIAKYAAVHGLYNK